jgi:CheY-like chemotaxis protein
MRHPRRILLVEDNPEEARRARESLAESGYQVFVAPSIAAARCVVAAGARFDLVFLDNHLPDGEGVALVPQMRAAGLAVPVVLVTDNRSERVGQMAFRAGCADLAIKDLDYHVWLPKMAEAFIATTDDDFRWGPHVLGVCAGRLPGKALRALPADLWTPLAATLQSATELAVQGLRASGHSLLGSLPTVHLELSLDLHLLLALRGGVFAAAMLTRVPDAQDTAELQAEAASFAKARSQSGE